MKTQISGGMLYSIFCVPYTIYHEAEPFEMVFADRIL